MKNATDVRSAETGQKGAEKSSNVQNPDAKPHTAHRGVGRGGGVSQRISTGKRSARMPRGHRGIPLGQSPQPLIES